MKTDRHRRLNQTFRVKLFPQGRWRWVATCLLAVIPWHSEGADPTPANPAPAATVSRAADPTDLGDLERTERAVQIQAERLLEQVLYGLVHGPAFDAKVRETVWTSGREVVGVGTYEQAGGGSGRYHLQLTMHDGTGKHRLQQISDGRLVWTRSQIAGRVSLRRVDVGRLDQWVQGVTGHMNVAPRLRVGGWAEMLSKIQRESVLSVKGAQLADQPVWVIVANLKPQQRELILAESGRDSWPPLLPTRVLIAVQSQPDPTTGFGQWLPIRLEYWSDPIAPSPGAGEEPPIRSGRLITRIELYKIRPIDPPPAESFRFENQDAEVNFVNETDRYIELYDVHLTERDRRMLRR